MTVKHFGPSKKVVKRQISIQNTLSTDLSLVSTELHGPVRFGMVQAIQQIAFIQMKLGDSWGRESSQRQGLRPRTGARTSQMEFGSTPTPSAQIHGENIFGIAVCPVTPLELHCFP
ncbi:uncharacterized protein LOC144991872 [Oryzias latipes]